MCQIFGHAAKLIYFGAVIEQAASVDPIVAALAVIASMIGTSLAAKVLLAMTDRQYRSWANRIITAIAGYYVAHGAVLIVLTARDNGAPAGLTVAENRAVQQLRDVGIAP